jgi:two-component system chemotaxis response regulator CheB
MNTKEFIEESKIRLCDAVKAAAKARINRKIVTSPFVVEPKLSADAVIPATKSYSMIKTTDIVVAVGASTGGTDALQVFLQSLQPDCPGIVIVQHMPENFTRSFANRLMRFVQYLLKKRKIMIV